MKWGFRLVLICLLFCACCMDCFAASGGARQHNPFVNYWMGIYLGQVQIGYAHITLQIDKYGGNEVLHKKTAIRMLFEVTKFVEVAQRIEFDLDYDRYADMKLNPLADLINVTSRDSFGPPNGALSAEILYGPNEINVKDNGNSAMSYSIPITDELKTQITNSFMYDFGGIKLHAGDRLPLYQPDIAIGPHVAKLYKWKLLPFTLAVKKSNGGNPAAYSCSLLSNGNCMAMLRQGETGELLELSRLPDRITWRLKTKDITAEIDAGKAHNITVIEPDHVLPNPRDIDMLTVDLVGVADKRFALNDSRQSATYSPGAGAIRYKLIRQRYDGLVGAPLSVCKLHETKYLGSGVGVRVDDPNIRQLADSLVAGETDSYKAAQKIIDWLSVYITYKGNTSVPLNASDILKERRGVCAHYALLYTALARAAGIPTRIAAGLIYDLDRAFHYHAWAESYVGKWISLDPTSGDYWVDSDHIKLLEGFDSRMLTEAPDLMGVKASIVECEPKYSD